MHVDEIVHRHERCARKHIFKLPDVSRPGVLQQHGLCAAREALNPFSVGGVIFLDKKSDQLRDVFQALGQAGTRIWIVLNR